MGRSVWPVDGLLSVSQGLSEGDTEVAGLRPSVFLRSTVCTFMHGMFTYVHVISTECAVISANELNVCVFLQRWQWCVCSG